MSDYSYKGRVAVVTGGASGIGEATARLLAEFGATVVIADIDRQRASLVAAQIGEVGGDAHSIPTDIREEEEIKQLVNAISGRWGRADILVNNAASLELTEFDGDVLNLSPQVFLDTVRGSVFGAFLMSKALLPLMLDRGSGSIVNIASVSGMAGEPALTAYGVAKAGVIQLTRALSTQYARRGIRANAIAPAFVNTRNNETYASPVFVDVYRRNMSTGFTAETIDIARLVAFLASEDSRMVAGHVIAADGGLTDTSPISADYVAFLSEAEESAT